MVKVFSCEPKSLNEYDVNMIAKSLTDDGGVALCFHINPATQPEDPEIIKSRILNDLRQKMVVSRFFNYQETIAEVPDTGWSAVWVTLKLPSSDRDEPVPSQGTVFVKNFPGEPDTINQQELEEVAENFAAGRKVVLNFLVTATGPDYDIPMAWFILDFEAKLTSIGLKNRHIWYEKTALNKLQETQGLRITLQQKTRRPNNR